MAKLSVSQIRRLKDNYEGRIQRLLARELDRPQKQWNHEKELAAAEVFARVKGALRDKGDYDIVYGGSSSYRDEKNLTVSINVKIPLEQIDGVHEWNEEQKRICRMQQKLTEDLALWEEAALKSRDLEEVGDFTVEYIPIKCE